MKTNKWEIWKLKILRRNKSLKIPTYRVQIKLGYLKGHLGYLLCFCSISESRYHFCSYFTNEETMSDNLNNFPKATQLTGGQDWIVKTKSGIKLLLQTISEMEGELRSIKCKNANYIISNLLAFDAYLFLITILWVSYCYLPFSHNETQVWKG